MNIYRTAIVKFNNGDLDVIHMDRWFSTHKEATEYIEREYRAKVVKMFRGYVNKYNCSVWLILNRKNMRLA